MPPAGKAEQALRARKDARQKKVLFALAPILVGLLAWQGPGMLKAFTGGDSPPPTAAQPTETAAAPDPAAGAAPSTATGDPAVTAPGGSSLPDADEPYTPGAGQLVAFDRFIGKDPFRQQVAAKAADGGAPGPGSGGGKDGDGSGGGGGSGGSGGDDQPPGGGDDGDGDGDAFASATLAVNGVSETVSVDGTFPSSDPVFRLVSIGGRSVKIGLVAGEFSNGARTVTVALGKKVTLVSQPDGFRFTIKLVALGDAPLLPQP
jgi:hypothetical protein